MKQNLQHIIFAVTLGFVVCHPIQVAGSGRFDDCLHLRDSGDRRGYEMCRNQEILGDSDCPECIYYEGEKSNPWVDSLAIMAPVLGVLGSAYFGYKGQKTWANAYQNTNQFWANSFKDTNEYWSNAFVQGQQACSGRLNSYLNYVVERGANPVGPGDYEGLMGQCNGLVPWTVCRDGRILRNRFRWCRQSLFCRPGLHRDLWVVWPALGLVVWVTLWPEEFTAGDFFQVVDICPE